METVDRYLEARIEQEHSTISFQDKETLVVMHIGMVLTALVLVAVAVKMLLVVMAQVLVVHQVLVAQV